MSLRPPVILLAVVLAACGAAPSAQAAVTGGVSGGILTLTGDAADDTIRLSQDPSAPASVSFHPRPAAPVAGCVEAPTGGGDGVLCDGVTAIVVDGGPGEDNLDAAGVFAVPVTLRGGGDDDVLHGGDAADELEGGADDDILFPAGAGDGDLLDGGPGSDTVWYPTGLAGVAVTLPEPGATSTGNGTPGDDDALVAIEHATGTDGADTLTGSSLDNTLVGGQGADTISAGDGDDTIHGFRPEAFENPVFYNTDVIDAGPGNDTVFSRDAIAEDVDCGPGADRVQSDTKQERVVSCEVVAAQVFGELRFVGTPQVGQQLTMAGVEVLGTPTPTATFTWRRCRATAPSSCSVIRADPALLLTEPDAASGVVLRGTARYSNGFGADEAEAGPMGSILPAPPVSLPPAPPAEQPLPPPPPAPPAGAGPVVPFDGRAAAARAMGAAAAPIAGWRSTAISAVRPRRAVPLSRRGDRRVVAFACAVERCEIRLRPRLRVGRRTITLSPVRVRMVAGEARYVTVWLTSSARRAVLRARTARLLVSVTADPAAGVPRSFTVSVR